MATDNQSLERDCTKRTQKQNPATIVTLFHCTNQEAIPLQAADPNPVQ
jgi:hypothetical protein